MFRGLGSGKGVNDTKKVMGKVEKKVHVRKTNLLLLRRACMSRSDSSLGSASLRLKGFGVVSKQDNEKSCAESTREKSKEKRKPKQTEQLPSLGEKN